MNPIPRPAVFPEHPWTRSGILRPLHSPSRPVQRPWRVPFQQLCLGLSLILVSANGSSAEGRQISALGRLEPGLGVVRVASPSVGSAVIASLAVEEGEWVESGQLLATLDDHALHSAEANRLEAELANAQRAEKRTLSLSRNSVTSQASLDVAELAVRVAQANVAAARARLSLSEIRAPIHGQILEVHTRPGERVGDDGVLEMGNTKKMVAVAEVYETDIRAVAVGQQARVSSSAFEGPLTGVVSTVGLKVGRMDVLGADPVAKTDARVVEVRINLDSSERVERLTNLQVEIEIQP